MTKEVSDFANSRIITTPKTFTYGEWAWGSSRLRHAMAAHMTRSFSPANPVNASNILFANGITSICELLAFTIAEPGDGILLPRPVYQTFVSDFGTKGQVNCIFTASEGIDQFSPAFVERYEQALLQAERQGTKIRALILCNPHNPLGRCHPKETIVALMRFCQRHKIHLIADEIYALSVYDIGDPHAVPFTSVISFDSQDYIDQNLLHVLYGLSKDFASGGLRLGCIYTRNEALMDAMGAIAQFSWSGCMNETLAILMLEDEKWLSSFFKKSQTRLAERNLAVRRILEEKGVAYATGANAGFFLWIDLRPWLPKKNQRGETIENEWEKEAELSSMIQEKRLYFTDGQSMNAEEAGWFRIIFSQDEEVIKEGLKRLFEVLGV